MRHRLIAAIAVATTLAGAVIAAWQPRDITNQTAVAPAGSGVLTGLIVTDTIDPQPVRRATVRLTGENASTPRMVGTDDDGRFVFDRLPAGRFTVSASKAGFVQTFHGSTRPGRGPGVPVAVADGQRVDVAIKLLPGAVISGTIRDGRGNPAPGVTVAAVETRPSGGAALAPVRVVTDDRGVYRVFGLAPGQYLVSALPQLDTGLPGRLGSAGSVVTAVTDADVQWAKSAGGATARVGVGAGGGPLSPPARPVGYAPVFYPGTTDAALAATIRVASGEERAGVDLPLQIVALARLAGTLLDGNGQPLTSAIVSLVPKRGDQPSPVDPLVASGALALPRATVSASGFAFSGVAPGQYTLIARTGSGQRGAVAAEARSPTLWSVIDVIVDGADRTDLSLRLLRGLRVTGRYVFERGAPPPADPATLNLSLVATSPLPGVSSTFRAALKPDGTFEIPSIAPGGYIVRADAAATPAGARWILKSAIVDDRDLADRPLQAAAGADEVSNVVVTFTDRAAEISGRLIDASGRPVTRYSIVVVTQDRSLWLPNARRLRLVRPATDGSFAVSDLPAGEYAIAAVENAEDAELSDAAFLSQLLASALKLTLAEGEKKHQDLRTGG
jgi:Carboxypeptidase regulatory-like domain